MAEFILLMKGSSENANWSGYIEKLISTGQFRGGSAFGNGRAYNNKLQQQKCVTDGYMKFEAPSIGDVELFLSENPTIKAGGSVELHELVITD